MSNVWDLYKGEKADERQLKTILSPSFNRSCKIHPKRKKQASSLAKTLNCHYRRHSVIKTQGLLWGCSWCNKENLNGNYIPFVHINLTAQTLLFKQPLTLFDHKLLMWAFKYTAGSLISAVGVTTATFIRRQDILDNQAWKQTYIKHIPNRIHTRVQYDAMRLT